MNEHRAFPTDLDLLYEVSDELSYHLQRVILHLHQAHGLLEMGLSVCKDRFSEDGSVFLHADLDNRALLEIVLFPLFWLDVLSRIEQETKQSKELLSAGLPETFVLNMGKPIEPLSVQSSAYQDIWRAAGLKLLQALQRDAPARRVLAQYYGSARPIEQCYELYQTEAYPSVFREASEDGLLSEDLWEWDEPPSSPEDPEAD